MAVELEGFASISIDENRFTVDSNEMDITYLTPVHLEKGIHTIEIGCLNTRAASFDVAWLYSVEDEEETLEEVFAVEEKPAEVLSYKRIDATEHIVRVNASEPFMLSLTEAYDPLWVAKVNGKEYKSLPLYSVVNGFWIEDTGELEITVKYKPQTWFYYGAAVSSLSLLLFLAYIMWDWRRGRRAESGSRKDSSRGEICRD